MTDRDLNQQLNLEEAKPQLLELKSKPVRAWIAFTEECNLKCAHCPRSVIANLDTADDLSPEIFSILEQELFPILVKCKVGGNNLGEQLLAEEWSDFTSRMGQFSFAKYLVTNGLLLNEEKRKLLLAQGWTIDFSTEGATEETYRKIRKSSFNKFITAVEGCCQQKELFPEAEARVRFCFTVFKDNLAELPQLIELASKLGVDEIMVTHLIPMSEDQRQQSLVYHKELANDIFQEAVNLACEKKVSLKLPPLFPPDDSRKNKETNVPTCHHPWSSISINRNGDVLPCCLYDKPMGNLREQNFQEIWNGPKYIKLRKTVNSSNPLGMCKNCSLRGGGFTSRHCQDDQALLGIIGTNQSAGKYYFRLKLKKWLKGLL